MRQGLLTAMKENVILAETILLVFLEFSGLEILKLALSGDNEESHIGVEQ